MAAKDADVPYSPEREIVISRVFDASSATKRWTSSPSICVKCDRPPRLVRSHRSFGHAVSIGFFGSAAICRTAQ